MHSITPEKQKLTIFLEAESLGKYSLTNKDELDRLLVYGYRDSQHFDFIRSPVSSNLESFLDISEFKLLFEEDKLHTIQIGDMDAPPPSECTEISFNYSSEDIMLFAKEIYNKVSINSDELQSVLMVFIHLTFVRYGVYSDKQTFVFVTQNRTILKKREWIEKKLGKLNIMTVDESTKYMDLFAKHQGSHYVEPNHFLDKNLWYWDSFRTKIPHYHVPARENQESVHILEGFAARFKFLLLALDEIGVQVYFPRDEDIMIPYHFNYFLSLATGILDNLAIETKHKYGIKFNGDHIPSRTSLSGGGQDFIREIKSINTDLYSHIKNYGNLRKLIFELREVANHKEGFRNMSYREARGYWYFFVIQKTTQNLIKSCGDKPTKYDRFSLWGIFDKQFFIFLEPYRFVVTATTQLVQFCDRYLELLGFRNFFETLPEADQYRLELESFIKRRLGF